jgi:hypothetical protein
MASWQYAFLFPGPCQDLDPARGLDVLIQFELTFDRLARLLVPVDDKGHMLDVGEEVVLNERPCDTVAQMLNEGLQFSIQCRDDHIGFSFTFAPRTSNPHMFIGWSRRLFGCLTESIQNRYWEMIRGFAKGCNAAYVVIIDDAPDDFEDQFVDINGARVLDTYVNHSYGHGIQSIWVDESRTATPPEGVSLVGSTEIGQHFRKYLVPK